MFPTFLFVWFFLKFSFSYKFFESQIFWVASFFESQVLLDVLQIVKWDKLIQTLSSKSDVK